MKMVIELDREQLLQRMAEACARHLARPDLMLVAQAAMSWPQKFRTYVSANTGPWTDPEFAAWALQCAKRTISDFGRSE